MAKLIIFGIVVIIILAVAYGYFGLNKKPTSPYSNTKVMYGYSSYDEYIKNRPEVAKTADESLINFVMNSGEVKSRAEASQNACNRGSDYSNKGDKETAIKRYNQAWLFDPKQPCIFAGFGSYYADSPKTVEKSFEMYEKALTLANPSSENDIENPWWILVDYGEALDRAYISDNKRIDYLDKALDNLTKSLAIKDTPKAHRALSFVYYHKGDYKEAWSQVHLAVNGGVDLKNFGTFIDVLKKAMPDPEGKY
ncbi:hypothetical protein HYW44_05200 [Candidatus Daviesbacteria bacterium]|nr:hypothetical protein [Candidatus Daviesbacteria bacterium]